MSLAYVIIDVFTDTPLQGNQLAVFENGSGSATTRCSAWPGR
jgi:predicted PhzF superfamily epimerase YddE/YHI9